jgi:hypothetical protein
VDLFRKLLAMTTRPGSMIFLTNRPPAVRLRIQAKLREYAALDPNERELRLRATELRWYLLPLLHESPTNRAAQLTAIPADLRALVNARLLQWDILPPPLQTEFFESEHALRYPSPTWTRPTARRCRRCRPCHRASDSFTASPDPIWRTGIRFPKR